MMALVAAATTYALLTAPHAVPTNGTVCTAHTAQAECLPGLTHTAHTAPHRDITVTTTGHDTALAYTVRTYADAGIVRTHVKLY
jgi:hypothetical protein